MSYLHTGISASTSIDFQDLFLYGSDGVVVIDEKRTILALNPAAESMTGWEASEVAGKKDCRRVFSCHAADGGRLCSLDCPGIRTIQTTAPTDRVELRITTKAGAHREVEATFVPIPSAGQPAAAILLRDLTDRKRREEISVRLAAEREIDKLRAEFLARVSHELRTPLTTVLAGSQLLAKARCSPEKVHEIAGKIQDQARDMSELVENLLELSRMVAEGCEVRTDPVEVLPLLQEIAGRFEGASALHRVVLAVPKRLPRVQADRRRIKNVVDILVENAIRYSPRGGAVTIRAERDQDFVCISVADEGAGIPREKFDLVFAPFYRVDGSLAKRVRGAGLGLALCKHVVEMHGGRIWLDSQVGVGSVFYFTVPAIRAGSPQGLIC